ncbi:MAG: hypothetical protein OCD01_17485 [Fibrobacterales bacterium]
MKLFKTILPKLIGASLICLATSATANELLQNNSFYGEGALWETHTAHGVINFGNFDLDNVAKYEPSSSATSREDLQLFQKIHVTEGRTYNYRFGVRSPEAASRNIDLVFQQPSYPYTIQYEKTFRATNEWIYFCGSFVASATEEIKVSFMGATDSRVLYIDDISVTDDQTASWTAGWDVIRTYKVDGLNHLLTMNSTNGSIKIYKLNDNGTIGANTYEGGWGGGWTHFEPYIINGTTYMLMYKAAEGHAEFRKMESDGTVGGSKMTEDNWTLHWSKFTSYQVGDKHYMFMTKSTTGQAKIFELINSGPNEGALGPRTYYRGWTAGWDDAQVTYTNNNETVMWLRKSGTGQHDIHVMNNTGTFGPRIDRRWWTTGWTTARFINIDKEPYLFLNKVSNRHTYISKLNDNGVHMYGIYNQYWNFTWTGIDTFETLQGTFAFLVNKYNGDVEIEKLIR